MQKLLNTGLQMVNFLKEINKLKDTNMKTGNSADIYEDSGIKPLLNEMDLEKYFEHKDYGNNEVELFFVINCLQSHIKERRPRFDNKDKTLYFDIMLDYEIVKKASIKNKKIILANAVIDSFEVLDKYKKLHLNKEKIKKDAKEYFIKLGWLYS